MSDTERAESGTEACARVLREQRDYYRVLDVSRGASAGEVKRAYRTLARVLHPDKCRDPRATEAMAVVTRIWMMIRVTMMMLLMKMAVVRMIVMMMMEILVMMMMVMMMAMMMMHE